MDKEEIMECLSLFFGEHGGIEGWLRADTDTRVFRRLSDISKQPLSLVQFNQLLVLGHEAGMSQGFFEYYWAAVPGFHPYDVTSVPHYDPAFVGRKDVVSLEHLSWGFYRIYVDALLFYGNIRMAYREMRTMSRVALERMFSARSVDTPSIVNRGPALELNDIPKDNRYLISEMACKSFDSSSTSIQDILLEAWDVHARNGGGPARIIDLVSGTAVKAKYDDRQMELELSTSEIFEETVKGRDDLLGKVTALAEKFQEARRLALDNTKLYLSMVPDLDVYVATSMRKRDDFRRMAEICSEIFDHRKLVGLHLRHFDPTLSAADGHEDKGLIECLMVKSARVLVYCAGDKESFGKDAEAAMALSLGKPVIFLCEKEDRARLYREVHPLSRLIDFKSGVAVGAMVATNAGQVSELLRRHFTNKMEYTLERASGRLRLRERLTNCVVRVQTDNRLLRETFWNYYHNRGEEQSD